MLLSRSICLTILTLLLSLPFTAKVMAQPSDPQAESFSLIRLTIPDGENPALEAGIWVRTDKGEQPRPLVVISHGNGGYFRSHVDTAMALAQAGYVVAAITHTGDNWRDQSRAIDLAGRTRQLSALVDYLTRDWEGRDRIDANRIGGFGFSAGGFTVLASAGGKPDMSRISDHCRQNPSFYDCQLIARHPQTQAAGPFVHDPRLKAIVIAAPALGYAFPREGLLQVTMPVQLWQAGQDQILPAPFYAEPVRDNLPNKPEYHLSEGAGHFDFLTPCSAQMAANAPIICTPTPDFDRASFHEILNSEIVRFFERHL